MFYSDVNSIKDVFYEYAEPIWGLYDGKARRTPPNVASDARGRLFYQDSNDMDIPDSWSRLEGALSRVVYKGGYCTIYVGTGQNALTIPCYFDHPGQSGGQNTGITGANFGGMGIMRELFDEKLRNYELKREYEDLQLQRGPNSFWERVGEKLLENEQLPNLVMGVLNSFQKMATNPQLAQGGQYPQQQQVYQRPRPQTDSEKVSGPTQTPELALQQFGEQIKGGFSDGEEMAQYLAKLAVIFQANPEGMKAVIDNAIKQSSNEQS
jgi:hypothetical protein